MANLMTRLSGLLAAGARALAGSRAALPPEKHFLAPSAFVPVRSSNVLAVGYWADSRKGKPGVLGVRFRDRLGRHSGTYVYYGRDWRVFRAMLAAPSKGKFVHQVLTPGGNYKRIA